MLATRLLPVASVLAFAAVLPLPAAPRRQATAGEWTLESMVGQDRDGRPVYRHRPVDERFRNPISDEDEAAFQERARHVIALQAALKVPAGNTYFENEKRTYGFLMAQVLAGRREAIRELQLEDAQASQWHAGTKGIDFYACFTLKHQTRKLFYFGDLLEPGYRARMLEGARAWTEVDPLRRPHPAFEKPGEGWGPDAKNSWVDVRSTENLYLMRVTSVYLFAEASGSRETAAKYKEEIRKYAIALYRVGIGEWDSENYHGHSVGPLCNLLDFAADEEVRLLAKACLDWFFAAGAVKYWRGGFTGPTRRDYNHVQPFGGSAANMLWVGFGDAPRPKEGDWESDEVHLITSSYRPPPAVLALARKRFERPLELLASKPQYTATTSGDLRSPPESLEVQYFGHTFQMGSLAGGTSTDGGDINGFKILVWSEERGAETIQCVPGPDPTHAGSPAYQAGKVSGPNRVAQLRNIAIWLVRDGKSPWVWLVPRSVSVDVRGDVTLLACDRTWIAVRGLGTSALGIDEELTRRVAEGDKARFPGCRVLSAAGSAEGFCGVAIEVGEAETHGTLDGFRRKALDAKVDASGLSRGVVEYAAAGGGSLRIEWADDPLRLGVQRDGEPHDWSAHAAHLYLPAGADGPAPPIWAPRGAGTLYVEAGGHAFVSSVSEDGRAAFRNGEPAALRASLPAR